MANERIWDLDRISEFWGKIKSHVSSAISGKADKVSSPTNGNFAGLDANGNLTDSGRKASDFLPNLNFDIIPTQNSSNLIASGGVYMALSGKKNTQTAVSDPTASGNSLAFVDSISQNSQGVITPTKKNVALDNSPTEDSNNPVKSGGVYTAIRNAVDSIGNVVTEIPLSIEASSWSSSSPYTYTWTDSRVLSDSSVEVDILNTSADTTAEYLDYAKTSGGGGIVFTANKKPTASISVIITITNAQAHAGSSIDADTVATDTISGAENVDEALIKLNEEMVKIKSDIGIVEDTDTATHTISEGQYVIWKGVLYTAKTAIPSGTTLSTSNLQAVSGGGLNALNSKITTSGVSYSKNTSYVGNTGLVTRKLSSFILIEGWFVVSTEIPANTAIFTFTGINAYRDMYCIAAQRSKKTAHVLKIERDGDTLFPDIDALPIGTYIICMVIDSTT